MKNIITIFFFLMTNYNIFCQRINFSINNESLDCVYANMDNIISAFIENESCDLISLKTDNGVIKKGENCQYIINPNKIGKANIYIILKKNNKIDTIGMRSIIVKELIPCIRVFGLEFVNNGILPKDSLKYAVSLIGYYDNIINSRLMPKIIEYRIIVVRRNKIFYIKLFNNPIFSDDIKNCFHTIEVGDDLIFDKIKYVDINGDNKFFQPIEYIIK